MTGRAAILELIADLVLPAAVLDPAGIVVYVSRPMEDLLPEGAAAGALLPDIWGIPTSAAGVHEVEIPGDGVGTRWVEFDLVPLPFRNGRNGMIVTGRDVTRRHVAEEALKASKTATDDAGSVQSAFLATMSHELRTPMNGVLATLELVQRTPGLPDQARHQITVARDSGTHLLRILDEILDFSKIEAGRMEIDALPFSAAQVVEGVVELLAPGAVRKGLAFPPPAIGAGIPGRLRGDPTRLRQIVLNLVSNAIKFTHRGSVSVRCELAGERRQDGRIALRIAVTDTGIGLSKEALSRLFQPFHQADSSTTRRFGGTGLGLAISRELANLMGGSIEVVSEPGKGSTFAAIIPFDVLSRQEWSRISDSEDALPLPDLSGRSVHVVSADKTACDALEALFADTRANLRFHERADLAETAIHNAIADGQPPRLVITDLQLPDRSGLDLRGRLGKWRVMAQVPWVMLGPDDPSLRTQAYEVGMKAYLPRPFLRSTAAAVLNEVLGGGQEGEEVQPTTREEAKRRGRLLLLVEDNEVNRTVVGQQLLRLGWWADPAVDGIEALELLESGRADYRAVVSDIHMPRLDGEGLVRAIREQERASGADTLPVIALTAHAVVGEGDRYLSLGFTAYLSKPVTLQALGKAIAAAVRPAPMRSPALPAAGASSSPAAPVEPPPPVPSPAVSLEAPVAAGEQGSPIDWEMVESIYGEISPQVLEQLRRAPANVDQCVTDLRAAASEDRREDAHRHAHSAKGVARYLGADRLSAGFAAVDEAVKRGDDWPQVLRLLEPALVQLALVREAVDQAAAGGGPSAPPAAGRGASRRAA